MEQPALLDTDTLSEVMKGRDLRVRESASQYLSVHARFTFSIITRYEILRGLCARGARRQVERFHERCRSSEVLGLSDEVVDRAAEVYAHLHGRGELISDADILISATALVHGLRLVTENAEHFRRVPGLTLESWRA